MIDRDVVLLLILPLLSGVLSAWLGRTASSVYWATAAALALIVTGLSLGTSWYAGMSLFRSLLYAGLFLLVPIAVAFRVGRLERMRAWPLASVVAVAASHLATVFLVMTLAINLGLPH